MFFTTVQVIRCGVQSWMEDFLFRWALLNRILTAFVMIVLFSNGQVSTSSQGLFLGV